MELLSMPGGITLLLSLDPSQVPAQNTTLHGMEEHSQGPEAQEEFPCLMVLLYLFYYMAFYI